MVPRSATGTPPPIQPAYVVGYGVTIPLSGPAAVAVEALAATAVAAPSDVMMIAPASPATTLDPKLMLSSSGCKHLPVLEATAHR